MIRGTSTFVPTLRRSFSSVTTDIELDAFNREVAEVKAWWQEPRWKDIERKYTAEDVVKLRGNVKEDYPGSDMSLKAFNLFEKLKANKQCTATFGALDPVHITQMAKYLPTIYVSGWQSSSTCSTSNEPGPDLADYPMDTVPNKVEQLFQAQLFHDRKQRNERMSSMTSEQRLAKPPVDYLAPIIADADTGHGGTTAVMKLAKMFVQRGASGMHLEDQKPGTKKCGHMGGKVLVATQEHVDRLCAARLQCDILGSNTLIVARTDSEAANLLDSNIDPRDQWQILGTTDINELGSEREYTANEIKKGNSGLKAQEEWSNQANLCTLSQAVENELRLNGFEEEANRWIHEARLLSHQEIVELAKTSYPNVIKGKALFTWSDDKARTREGYFRTLPGIDASIKRGLAYAPHADLIWMETATPCLKQAKLFADAIKSKYPNQTLAYNLSPSFNWDATGMNGDELAAFNIELGKLGFVWQFITLAGLHLNALAVDKFANDFSKRGMQAYVETIQREERNHGVETLTHQQWSGAALVDAQLATLDSTSSTLAMGSGVTEQQF
mmetsp:Transcript_17168/g.20221  ORF Transcript_17168/g.20221 Transcript_17168/m.20221 type:complete len:556 (-) Transcript_17168:187-1854(-)